MPKNILITSASSGMGAPTARALTGLRLVPHDPPKAAAAPALALDGADPVAQLASAVAALLLEAIAGGEPGDPAAAAALLDAVAELPGKQGRPSLPPGGPVWSAEPLTQSETRVLRFLPTYMSAREIAAELCVSANTVRTHMQHVYRKLGARSRHEAVQRARAAGLLPASSCSHKHRSQAQLCHCRLTIARTDPVRRPDHAVPGSGARSRLYALLQLVALRGLLPGRMVTWSGYFRVPSATRGLARRCSLWRRWPPGIWAQVRRWRDESG